MSEYYLTYKLVQCRRKEERMQTVNVRKKTFFFFKLMK